MSNFPIVGETRSREYCSTEYGKSTITIEVIGFNPCLDSWKYDPPYIDNDPIHPDLEEREMPAFFRGKDLTTVTITLEAENGSKHRRHASISRIVHQAMRPRGTAKWESSCMIRHKNGIRIGRNGKDNRHDIHRSKWDMLWDWSTDNPLILDELLNMLLDECDVIFHSNRYFR